MAVSCNDILQHQRDSLDNKEKYWEKVAEKLVWTKKWTTVFEKTDHPYGKWFSGAELNVCYNCVDRHVNAGHGDRTAYVFDSPVSNTHRVYTFSDVLDEVSRLAGVLISMGVKKGDVVMIIMPMIPEGAFSMLACARIGAFHAAITSGLTHPDIAQKIDHCKPKVILMASHGHHANGWLNYKKEVDAACDMAKIKPKNVLLLQREEQPLVSVVSGRDMNWKEEMSKAKPVDCVSVGVNDPSFLIYTSGSTGEPKAVVHAGGLFTIRWAHDGPLMMGSYEERNLMLATVNYGWIGGAMIMTYGFLLNGLPVLIFEGDSLLSEDLDLLYSTIEKNKVTRTFVRPGIWKSIKGKDPEGKSFAKYDLHRMKDVFMAGERTDNATMEWICKTFKCNLWNCYGQTETAGLISGLNYNDDEKNPKVHDYSLLCPGNEVKVINDDGGEAKPFELGKIYVKTGTLPLSFITLLNDHENYLKKYFSEYPGYFCTMDQGCVDDKGRLRVESRSDDMMKVGLHYVTSQAIEEVVMKHKSVSECVVVSSTDLVWKEIPVTIYVKKPDSLQSSEEIEKEVHDSVHSVLGDTLKLGSLVQVQELPITRSGKLHRPSCRSMVRGNAEIAGLGNVENPDVLPDVKNALLKAGYGKDDLLD